MTTINLDFETRSMVDLTKAGAWRYAEDTSTDIFCMYYKTPDMPDAVGWYPGDPVPDTFKTPAGYVARYALFEYAMIKNILIPRYGFPDFMAEPTRWICTRALSLCVGLPGSLEKGAAALGVAQQKLDAGKGLINKYSKPVTDKKKQIKYFRELKGEDKNLMFDYCRADVLADSQCYEVLKGLSNGPLEREVFELDFKQNVKGLPVDVAALNKFLKLFETATARAEKEAEKIGVNTRSGNQMKEYFSKIGVKLPDLKALTVEAAFNNKKIQAHPQAVRVLELRQFLAKASVKKYSTLKIALSPDNKIRYFLRYFGAHTGRWSGAGFQPHNLPKTKTSTKEIDAAIKGLNDKMPYPEIIQAGKTILPGLIKAPAGETFLIGDFAAIEARGIAYLAGQDDLIKDFARGVDVYISMGATIYNLDPAKVKKSDKARTVGKVGILSCGYGAGVGGITAMMAGYGLPEDERVASDIVKTYRGKYTEIVNFWYELNRAFMAAWGGRKAKKEIKTGKYLTVKGENNYVKILLPSGRWLYYHNVKIDGQGASYWNHSQNRRVRIWGGLLAENVTQAMCRDILVECMLECDKQELNPVLHCHDEILCQIKTATAKAARVKFDKIMNTAPAWLPGFPLLTESEISKRYHK